MSLKSQFDKQGFLVVRNVLDFNFDLKPVLNDMEFIMNELIDKFVPQKNKAKVYKFDLWVSLNTNYRLPFISVLSYVRHS